MSSLAFDQADDKPEATRIPGIFDRPPALKPNRDNDCDRTQLHRGWDRNGGRGVRFFGRAAIENSWRARLCKISPTRPHLQRRKGDKRSWLSPAFRLVEEPLSPLPYYIRLSSPESPWHSSYRAHSGKGYKISHVIRTSLPRVKGPVTVPFHPIYRLSHSTAPSTSGRLCCSATHPTPPPFSTQVRMTDLLFPEGWKMQSLTRRR